MPIRGCNCQHFAADVALALGAQYRPAPEDERLAKSAANSANAVGAAGVSVAACAAAGGKSLMFHMLQPA